MAAATPWLIAWAAGGVLALLLVGAVRGDARFGATLPFWLVGAPLLDLAWVEHARLRRWLLRRLADTRTQRNRRNRGLRPGQIRFS